MKRGQSLCVKKQALQDIGEISKRNARKVKIEQKNVKSGRGERARERGREKKKDESELVSELASEQKNEFRKRLTPARTHRHQLVYWKVLLSNSVFASGFQFLSWLYSGLY